MVLQHHERFDGTGYPQKLKGDADSVAGEDFRSGRHLRCDDLRSALSQSTHLPRCPQRNLSLLRHTV